MKGFKYVTAPAIGTQQGKAKLARVEPYTHGDSQPGAVLHWMQPDGRTTRTTLQADSTEGPSRTMRLPVQPEMEF